MSKVWTIVAKKGRVTESFYIPQLHSQDNSNEDCRAKMKFDLKGESTEERTNLLFIAACVAFPESSCDG